MTFLFSFLFLLDAGQNLNVLFLVSWDPCFFSKEPQTFYGYLSNTWLTTNPCRLSQHGPLSLSLLHIPLTGSCQYLQLACPWVLLLKSKKNCPHAPDYKHTRGKMRGRILSLQAHQHPVRTQTLGVPGYPARTVTSSLSPSSLGKGLGSMKA